MRENASFVPKEDTNFLPVDDLEHHAVAKLAVAHELVRSEAFADSVRTKLARMVAGNRRLPLAKCLGR